MSKVVVLHHKYYDKGMHAGMHYVKIKFQGYKAVAYGFTYDQAKSYAIERINEMRCNHA